MARVKTTKKTTRKKSKSSVAAKRRSAAGKAVSRASDKMKKASSENRTKKAPRTKSSTAKSAVTVKSGATVRKSVGASVNSRKSAPRASVVAKTNSRGKTTKRSPGNTDRKTVSGKKTVTATPDGAIEESRPLPKTHLRPDELAEFKELLLEKRRELAGDVFHLSNESSGKNTEGGVEHSMMPIHMADLGSDNWEHEFTLGLIANEHVRIREIDEALARIENQSYGICLATHKRIRKARLRAKPWAKYCIAYAKAREEGRA